MIGGYEERLEKAGQITSTLMVKLNAMSLVASEQDKEGGEIHGIWKSMNFTWKQLLCFVCLFNFMAKLSNLGENQKEWTESNHGD